MQSNSSDKNLVKALKITIFGLNLRKKGVPLSHAQTKKQIFFTETAKPHFILSKYHMLWLSYVFLVCVMFYS